MAIIGARSPIKAHCMHLPGKMTLHLVSYTTKWIDDTHWILAWGKIHSGCGWKVQFVPDFDFSKLGRYAAGAVVATMHEPRSSPYIFCSKLN